MDQNKSIARERARTSSGDVSKPILVLMKRSAMHEQVSDKPAL